jgi:hypothetical protein
MTMLDLEAIRIKRMIKKIIEMRYFDLCVSRTSDIS